MSATSKLAVDVTNFNKVHFDMDYYVEFGQEAWRDRFLYGLTNGTNNRIVDLGGTTSSSGKVITMDISDLKGMYNVYFCIYARSSGHPVWVRVRSITFEK